MRYKSYTPNGFCQISLNENISSHFYIFMNNSRNELHNYFIIDIHKIMFYSQIQTIRIANSLNFIANIWWNSKGLNGRNVFRILIPPVNKSFGWIFELLWHLSRVLLASWMLPFISILFRIRNGVCASEEASANSRNVIPKKIFPGNFSIWKRTRQSYDDWAVINIFMDRKILWSVSMMTYSKFDF